jgi:pimeloyl-[acyl-carrier protein] methyl ester esterase
VTPRLLLRHGWALDASLWDGVLAALGEEALVADAGYYGRPFEPAGQAVIGVGHSLGALELLAAPPTGLKGIVALDGFARFGHAPDFPEGVPARVLSRMSRKLAETGDVLTDFIGRAGGTVAAGTPDLPRLVAGLEQLHALDGRACPLPVWRLNADGDPIATSALADASFAGLNVVECRRRPSTDHLSPLHAPQACADLIRAALRALA